MRVLIICYMLPPALYPTSIQMPRLMAHLEREEIGAVSGNVAVMATGLECYADFNRKLAFDTNADFHTRLSGIWLLLARRYLPFYARVPDEFRGWIPRAEAAIAKKLDETGFLPDVLITFSEPMTDHLLGFRLKRKLGIPWVAQFSDPWADSPFRRGQFLANIVNRRLERKIIAAADRIVFTSQETVDLVMRKYPAEWRNKVDVVVHGFDPKLYPPRTQKPAKLTVRYIGHFYGHRTPLPLFRALETILREAPTLLDGVQVELVGRVQRWIRWHPAFRKLPQGLVRLEPSVPYMESLKLMAEADLLLVIDIPEPFSVLLHSKLIDYIGAGVPIMGIAPRGTSASLISRLGGFVADPLHHGDIVAQLRRAITFIRDRRRAIDPAPWGNPAVRAEYHIDRVAADFSRIVHEAAQMSLGPNGRRNLRF